MEFAPQKGEGEKREKKQISKQSTAFDPRNTSSPFRDCILDGIA